MADEQVREMEKKTIIALILSALVIFSYQAYMSNYYPDAETASVQETRSERADTPITDDLYLELEGAREKPKPAEEEIKKTPKIPLREPVVETDKYIVTLSNDGGCIKSIVLKEYAQPGTGEAFKLTHTEDPEEGIFNISGIGGGLPRARYSVKERASEVVFNAVFDDGLAVSKKYIFYPSSYHIDLELYITNKSARAFQRRYSIIAASNIEIASKLDRRYTQIVSEVSGKAMRSNGKKGAGHFVEGTVNYTGLQNKYFSLITKTSAPTKGALLKQIDNDNLLSQLEIDKFNINPGSSVSHNFLLYAGPSNTDLMRPYTLGSSVSYGFFGGISKMLLAASRLFYRVFKNWGVAIILLSICVNLVLFPLSRKSYKSMKKIQELQPHMERLRNEHKDNPQKLNKEMMELYKKYNVNPMGGCLPMLLQMPIFIALYQALMRSLDLRGAGFLWIKDLSMPDAVSLPFGLPLIGGSVNILPILMSGAMVIQQQISTRKASGDSAQAKQQQQMMIIMPVLFLFIMYNFPSGLVLYWLTNTILTMFEQRAIMRA